MALQMNKKLARSHQEINPNIILLLIPIYEDEQTVEVKIPKEYLVLCKQNKVSELRIPLSYQTFDCFINIPPAMLANIDTSSELLFATIYLMPDAWRYLINQQYRLLEGLKAEDIYELYCKAPPEPPVTNWPADYFEKVVGNWEGEPLVRGEQGAYPVRLAID